MHFVIKSEREGGTLFATFSRREEETLKRGEVDPPPCPPECAKRPTEMEEEKEVEKEVEEEVEEEEDEERR